MPETPDGRITLALLVQQQQNILDQLDKLTEEIKGLRKQIEFIRPWVELWRYVAMAFGAAILIAIVAGILWAVAMSGALIG